ncbi:Ger(x)C family spore germination protein [Cohnella cholangitidis]|uniref:Ger(X)C family spore germination protein n=1 Tax=Cohnella cholangitidis TaxID=2598458 RepID=A0A7G5C7Q4_9BACL|nr:Ger(x)C family spore germination protein [Cohnella cholangitidis]
MFPAAIWIGVALLLNGCWDRTEINDMAIITAASIDKIDDRGIELSLQVFIPRALGGGGGMGGGPSSGGQKLTLVRSGKGHNIADAMSKLQSKLPRKVFWGHCKVFVLGEQFARNGVKEEMDFLARHPQPRERAYMYVSKGKASETLSVLPPLERYSAEVMRGFSDMQIGMKVTMKDFLVSLNTDGGAAALPMLGISHPQKGEKKTEKIPFVIGTGVFKGDKLVGSISMRLTRGVLWMRKELEKATITVKPRSANEGYITMNPSHQSIKLTPHIRNGNWLMTLKIKTEGDLVQNGTNLDPMNPDLLRVMEQAVQESIANRIEDALEKVQKEMKADIMGFAEEFHRIYPKQWEEVQKNWDEVFPTVQVNMNIQVNIRRPGLGTVPAAVPEDEVKKQ